MKVRRFFSGLLLLLLSLSVNAETERFAFLFIQGDKQTPFYVKLEDAMQPRYGKNYCIIPKMAPGPAHIEILFQQNKYAPQSFTVMIPKGGSRGFLLVKQADSFLLYDLQQRFYLRPGNRESEDRMPSARPLLAKIPERDPASEVPKKTFGSIVESAIKPVEKVFSDNQKKALSDNNNQVPVEKNPVFIPDMVLTGSQEKKTDSFIHKNPQEASSEKVVISNSDCPAPMSKEAFGAVFNELSHYNSDEERVEYLGSQKHLCYETWQVRTLAGRLEADAARYQFLHFIFPRTSDQGSFPLLDDLLTTEIWKAEFRRMVQPH